MDSPFERPYSLYEQPRGYGTVSASASTSRLGSPALGVNRGTDSGTTGGIPHAAGGGWAESRSSSTSNLHGKMESGGYGGSEMDPNLGTAHPADPLNGFNAFSTESNAYQQQQQQAAQQYSGYGSLSGNQYAQYYGNGQYGGQFYGSGYMPYVQYGQPNQFSSNPISSQLNGQYGNQIGGGQLGGSFSTYSGAGGGATAALGSLRSSSIPGSVTGSIDGTSDAGTAAAAVSAKLNVEPTNSNPNQEVIMDPNSAGSGWSSGDAPNNGGSTATSPAVSEKLGKSQQSQQPQQHDSHTAGNIVPPGSIYWCYIDLQGQEQGPFSGLQMNEWILYLMDATLMRRSTDTIHVSFRSLKQATGSNEPFVVLFSIKEWDAIIRKATEQTIAASQAETKGLGQMSVEQLDDISDSLASVRLADGIKAASVEVVPPSSTPNTPSPRLSNTISPATKAQKQVQQSDQQPQQSQQQQKQQQQQDQQLSHSSLQSLPQTPQPFPQPQQPKVLRAEPARAPATDPWKKPVRASPQISITELKQQELEKQKEKKKAASASGSTSGRRSSQQRNWLPLEDVQNIGLVGLSTGNTGNNPTTNTASSPNTTSTPTWGKKPVPPARSLADIQKEQAMKANSAKLPTSTLSANTGNASYSTPVSPASPVKAGRFHAPESAGSTSVTRGTNGTSITDGSNGSSASPAKLKTQRPAGYSSVTQAANAAKPTDELIHWARVCFKDLAKGIDQMELLEVFLSLPSNNSAKEFIAESIYGYSSTIDGRRFASDFISRKKSAEQTMPQGETWKDVLNRFNPNTQEQDPSFKVVTKKRGPKIIRP